MQFAGIDSSDLKMVKTQGPGFGIYEYLANPLDSIICVSNEGQEIQVTNGPFVETRITTIDGKRTVFYFDRLIVLNDTLYGNKSRMLELPDKIPLSDVVLIEVQDGQKNYRYVD